MNSVTEYFWITNTGDNSGFQELVITYGSIQTVMYFQVKDEAFIGWILNTEADATNAKQKFLFLKHYPAEQAYRGISVGAVFGAARVEIISYFGATKVT